MNSQVAMFIVLRQFRENASYLLGQGSVFLEKKKYQCWAMALGQQIVPILTQENNLAQGWDNIFS